MDDYVTPKKKSASASAPAPAGDQTVATPDLQAMIAASVAREVKSAMEKIQGTHLPPAISPPPAESGSGDRYLPEEISMADHSTIPPLQQAVGDILRQNSEPIMDGQVTFDIPLGAMLSHKVRNRIIQREYVELHILLDPAAEDEAEQLRRDGRKDVPRKVRDITQWVSAMHIYGAIYLQYHPTEVAAFFKYMELVRSMAKQTANYAWRIYDETFRRARQCSPIPWNRPLVHQYVGAMLSPAQNQPFRAQISKPRGFTTAGGYTVPKSFCFAHNTTGCTRPGCAYQHKCPKCLSENHTADRCRAGQGGATPTATASASFPNATAPRYRSK